MASALDILSFTSAAVAFLAVLALALPAYPGTRQAGLLVASIAASAAWGVVLAVGLYVSRSFSAWMLVVDVIRTLLWIFFVAWFLTAYSDARRLAVTLAVGALLLSGIAVAGAAISMMEGEAAGQPLWLAMVGLPLIGLLGLEQLFRNSIFEQRRVLRPLCSGIALLFVIDVFVFSQAVLFLQVNEALWSLRGVACVAAAPLLLFAIKQQPDWGHGVFVSRHVVFYTTSLVAAGLYFLAMAAGGYLIAAMGIAWGALLQLAFFACAGAALVYALFSVGVRRRLKVFISKHFYRNRYDYREEWLHLMQLLAGDTPESSVIERSVQALANLIEAQHGRLWLLDRQAGRFEAEGAWRVSEGGRSFEEDDSLVRFMRATHWIVDTKEYEADPERYSHAFGGDSWHTSDPTIFIPLIHAGDLIGIVGLDRPAGLGTLSYEDHDLLKTAGRQVAIFLEQERVREELSETRQFEAFSRLTAFLMHDLKNLIAQQELVVANAQRFKHRPEFIEDMIKTVESGAHRMRNVLDRLQAAAKEEHRSLVDISTSVEEACRVCSDRDPAPKWLGSTARGLRAAVDREKLVMAVVHAIRNAQDATPTSGTVTVAVYAKGAAIRIDVADTGCGMEPEFIRKELFRPFRSTKGAKGMGIGAYQIRETMRAAGGDVEVSSEVAGGTTLSMWLPAAASTLAVAGKPAA